VIKSTYRLFKHGATVDRDGKHPLILDKEEEVTAIDIHALFEQNEKIPKMQLVFRLKNGESFNLMTFEG